MFFRIALATCVICCAAATMNPLMVGGRAQVLKTYDGLDQGAKVTVVKIGAFDGKNTPVDVKDSNGRIHTVRRSDLEPMTIIPDVLRLVMSNKRDAHPLLRRANQLRNIISFNLRKGTRKAVTIVIGKDIPHLKENCQNICNFRQTNKDEHKEYDFILKKLQEFESACQFDIKCYDDQLIKEDKTRKDIYFAKMKELEKDFLKEPLVRFNAFWKRHINGMIKSFLKKHQPKIFEDVLFIARRERLRKLANKQYTIFRDMKECGLLKKAPTLIQELKESIVLLTQNLFDGTEKSAEEALRKNIPACQNIFENMIVGKDWVTHKYTKAYLDASEKFKYNASEPIDKVLEQHRKALSKCGECKGTGKKGLQQCTKCTGSGICDAKDQDKIKYINEQFQRKYEAVNRCSIKHFWKYDLEDLVKIYLKKQDLKFYRECQDKNVIY